jgi:hypothetical protein
MIKAQRAPRANYDIGLTGAFSQTSVAFAGSVIGLARSAVSWAAVWA